MLLRSVTLQDFGLYAGKQVIQLLPRAKAGKPRPIVLFGGKNGAGKTTLLDAVRLVLYGKLALGARVSQADYEEYLRDCIHRAPGIGRSPSEASICLEFDFSESGEVHRYQVSRTWVARAKSLVESLEITKDGKEIATVPREEWQFFLQELLPPGVSQLFFFDGERIKEIAEDTADDEHLSQAIKSLLGIELVGRLRTDLGLYIARNERSSDSNPATRLDEIMRDIERVGREVTEKNEVLADLTTRYEGQLRVAGRAKQQFVAKGGDVARNRGRLQAELAIMDEQRTSLLHEFQAGSSALWPLILAPKLLARTLSKMQSVDPAGIEQAARAVLGRFEEWHASAPPAVRKRWTEKHRNDLRKVLAEVGSEKSQQGAETTTRSFSKKEQEKIEQALRDEVRKANAFAKQFSRLEDRFHKIAKSLARVDETTTDFLFDELRAAEQTLGATHNQIELVKQQLKELRHQQLVLERERKRILEEQSEVSRTNRQLSVAARASKALIHYERALVEQKTRALEQAFVDCFNRLARKEDLVRGVRIDDKTFQATLIDAHGIEVPKQRLSAGERQVYAIAMLWALAKTSGRSLPIIIDTPLGRLDSDHRIALVERYLPEVSHQVVVLSTDTEIDAEIVSSLDQFISHSYLIDYLPSERRSVALPGYFGGASIPGGRRALQQA